MKNWLKFEIIIIHAYVILIRRYLMLKKHLLDPQDVRVYNHIKSGNFKITVSTGKSGKHIGFLFMKKEFQSLLGKNAILEIGGGMILINISACVEEHLKSLDSEKSLKEIWKEMKNAIDFSLPEVLHKKTRGHRKSKYNRPESYKYRYF